MSGLSAPAASAFRAIAGVLVRHTFTAAGTAIVARGVMDQQTADSITGPLAEYVLGAGTMLVGPGWGMLRAKLTHTRFARAWAVLMATKTEADQ